MKTTIGNYDRASRTVPVTFEEGDVIHKRDVNAVLTDKGTYDKAGTAARVDDVGMGVAQKIALGVIKTVPEEEPAAPAEATADAAPAA